MECATAVPATEPHAVFGFLEDVVCAAAIRADDGGPTAIAAANFVFLGLDEIDDFGAFRRGAFFADSDFHFFAFV